MEKKKIEVEVQNNLDWLQKFKNSERLFTSRQVFNILMERKYQLLLKRGNRWFPSLRMDKDFVKIIIGIDNFGEGYISLRWTTIGVLGVAKMFNLKLKEENLERLMV